MMTLRDDLIAAKALIDTPDKWGKGVGSYNLLDGYPLCAHGACWRHANAIDNDAAEYALRRALREALPQVLPSVRTIRSREDFGTVPEFNDHPETTHADVMALFDRAIASATPDTAE